MAFLTTTAPESTDNEKRSLQKIVQVLFDAYGAARPTLSYGPSTQPTANDSEELLLQKMNRLLGGGG